MVVVYYHVYCRYISTEIPHPYTVWSSKVLNDVIWIAVAMFLFISGFLFVHQLRRNRYDSYTALAGNKALHILIPYTVFTAFLMVHSGSFNLVDLLHGGFWHLWFLPMLFCCFVLYFPLYSFIQKSKNQEIYELILLILSYAASFIYINPEYAFIGFDNMLRWSFYFVLGMLIAAHYNAFDKLFQCYKLWIPSIALWGLNSILSDTPYRTYTWNNTLAVGLAIISLFWLSTKIKTIGKSTDRIILAFASGSMGVYIIHYFILIYSTSSTAFRLSGVNETASNFYVFIVLIAITIVSIAISYLITYVLSKFRFGKLIIG